MSAARSTQGSKRKTCRRGHSRLTPIVAGLFLFAGLPANLSLAESEGGHGAAKEKADEELPVQAAPPPDLTPAEQYCSTIIDAAANAQFALHKTQIENAEKELQKRVDLVAARTQELKAWIKRREDFTAEATDSLLQIYGKMKPETAAPQLLAMNEMVAAAILAKLSPKVASPILAEMEPTRAARLSAVIAAAGEVRLKGELAADAH